MVISGHLLIYIIFFQNVHEGKTYPCDVCDYVGATYSCLMHHKTRQHVSWLVCCWRTILIHFFFLNMYVHISTQYLSNYILSSLICISIFDQPFYFVYIYTNLSNIYLRLNHKTWQHVGSVTCPCLSLVYLSLCLFLYLIIINILIIFDIFLKVRRSVGRFVLISYKGGQLHFDASIGALVSSQRPQTFLCEQCSYACGDR